MTPKQQKVLKYLYDYIKEHKGISPSFEEIKAGVKYSSISDVYRITAVLKDRGLITQDYNSARSIYVTDKGKELLGET